MLERDFFVPTPEHGNEGCAGYGCTNEGYRGYTSTRAAERPPAVASGSHAPAWEPHLSRSSVLF